MLDPAHRGDTLSAMFRACATVLLWLLLAAAPSARALPPPGESPLLQLIARGDAALRAGDSISAIGYYRDAVTRAPRDPRGYVALGRGYLAVKESAHAREAFESGLRHTNGSEELSLGMVEVYEQLGQTQRALETVRLLARSAYDKLLVNETRARLAERRGAFTEALAARRARRAQLCAQGESARGACELEGTRVRALLLLLGQAERLGPAHCAARAESIVLTQLLDCR
jgi:tetratricopeptide (TPR) repeat protein